MTALATRESDLTEEPLEIKAVVIPEGEHPIREQDLDQEALKVLYRLEEPVRAAFSCSHFSIGARAGSTMPWP